MAPSYSSLNLVLLGPPGSGKGTQARLLAERYQLPHISTGDMLWGEVANGSGLGGSVERDLDRGQLVSDRVMSGMILQRLDRDDCARGFILDGYPRRLAQAELLDGILAELGRKIERVVLLDVPDDVLVDRLAGRLVHPGSGRAYHEVADPPERPGVDDATGEPLEKREDDRGAVVRDRLRVYHEHAPKVVEYYRNRGQLVTIDGNRSIDQVFQAIDQSIAARVVA